MNTLSFRDPISKVYNEGNTVYRKLDKHNYDFFKTLKEQNFFKEIIKKKKVQDFVFDERDKFVMKHRYIKNFVTSNEMSSYQLYLSGLHTLDLLIESLNNGYCLAKLNKNDILLSLLYLNSISKYLPINSGFNSWNLT